MENRTTPKISVLLILGSASLVWLAMVALMGAMEPVLGDNRPLRSILAVEAVAGSVMLFWIALRWCRIAAEGAARARKLAAVHVRERRRVRRGG